MPREIMLPIRRGHPLWVEPRVQQPEQSYLYPLFEHMSREHGLTLTDSEMDEIVRVVKGLDAAILKEAA